MSDKKKNKEANKKKSAKSNSTSWLVWISVAVIALVTYITFSPSLQNEFTNWDDPTYVMDNSLVVNTRIPVKEIFSTPVSLNYHPITILTLAWNYQNGKLTPKGYFQTNLLLHILNTILVFFFIFLLTRRNLLMASVVALLFGIHPMHVESVSWVSERKDVLYVFFFIAGLITYLKYRESKKIIWYIVTLLLFVLSCLSKGMAVVFPVILLLIDYFQSQSDVMLTKEASVNKRNEFFAPLRMTALANKIPFFILSLVFGIVSFKIQSGEAIADMQTFTIVQRLMFASYGAVMYIAKFFVPANLSAFYPYPTLDQNGNIPMLFYLSPFVLLGIAAVIYFFFRKEKAIVFGFLFYIVSVALVLQFISVGSAIMADRYSYLSYIGLGLAFAYLVNAAWEGKNKILSSLKYPLTAIVIIGTIIFSYQTYARTQVWKTTETLWTDVIAKYPNVQTAWKNRGNYYGQHNEIEKAMHDYHILIGMATKDSKIYSNLGNVYGLRKQLDSALWAYSKAIEYDPTNPDPYINRAITYCMTGKYELGFPDFDKALELDPNLSGVYSNRGYAYFFTGQYEKSLKDYNTYISFKPEDGAGYYLRSQVYKAMGNQSASDADFSRAKALGYKAAQ